MQGVYREKPVIKVGNSYRIAYEGLMEWLKAQKVNNTPEGAT